jgi:hypothetical protein
VVLKLAQNDHTPDQRLTAGALMMGASEAVSRWAAGFAPKDHVGVDALTDREFTSCAVG